MIRALLGKAFTIATATTFAATGLTLWQSPFAEPYRDRTEAELHVAFDRALHRQATPEVIAERINSALARGKVDEAGAILRLAQSRDIPVPAEVEARTQHAEGAASGWSTCLACAISTDNCPDLTRVATCNLPLELTPVGDAKAITGAFADYLSGGEVDRIDLTLGVVGLGSTAAVLASGGSSVSLKLGATMLRVARKTRAMSKTLMDEITGLAAGTLRLDRAEDVIRRTLPPEALIDTARTARLSALASDMGRLAAATSPGDALALLARADNANDLARLARIAETSGSEARGAVAVLGTARSLRLTAKLSEIAIAAVALLSVLAAQATAIALWALKRLAGGQVRKPRPRFNHPRLQRIQQ